MSPAAAAPQEDDPFHEAARDLRRTVGAEFRAEREAAEFEADQLARRRASIADVARQAAHRGDTVEVRVAGRAFHGLIAGVGEDHVWLTSEVGDVHLVAAAVSAWRTLPATSAGVDATDPGSIRALLRGCELDGRVVSVVLADGVEIDGAVRTVARDHVILADSLGEVLVAMPQVVAVLERPGRR